MQSERCQEANLLWQADNVQRWQHDHCGHASQRIAAIDHHRNHAYQRIRYGIADHSEHDRGANQCIGETNGLVIVNNDESVKHTKEYDLTHLPYAIGYFNP